MNVYSQNVHYLKKKIRNISIGLIALALLGFMIVPKILSDKNKLQGDGRPAQDQVLQVEAFVVKPKDAENTLQTVGTVVANEEVEIRSELARKITGIYFKEGTFVGKGKLLFKLDDTDLLAQLRKLELDEELQVKQAEKESLLLEKGLITADEYDIRLTNIEKIRADIELISINLDKTEIVSPLSGIAGFRNVSTGSFVNNTVPLTTVKDISKVKVDFSVPEKYMSEFSKGQQISFSVEGFDDEFSGTVVSYDPQIRENTRSLILRAIAGNPGGKLLPGSFVKVNLRLSTDPNAIQIPTEAVVPKQDGQSVFIMKDGSAKSVDIELSGRNERYVTVSSGLSEGDTVIVTNILRLRDNSKVKPIKVF